MANNCFVSARQQFNYQSIQHAMFNPINCGLTRLQNRNIDIYATVLCIIVYLIELPARHFDDISKRRVLENLSALNSYVFIAQFGFYYVYSYGESLQCNCNIQFRESQVLYYSHNKRSITYSPLALKCFSILRTRRFLPRIL